MKKLNEDFFKIHFDPEETTVSRDGNKVYATLYGTVTTPNYSLFKHLAMRNFNISATGVAYLQSDDEFVFETGKKIALAKAENKCYKKALNKIMHRVEELNTFNDCAKNFYEKTKAVVEHNEDYIKRIGK